MLFVVTGPSGCGKSVIVRMLLEEMENVDFSVSHTSRMMRSSEKEGKDYYFVSREEFGRMKEADQFVEWAIVHGNYYGTSASEIESKGAKKDLLLDIDVQGAQQIREKFKDACFVFILPPSFQELKRRLEKRGQESLETIQIRLEVARKEVREYDKFDYIIINDQLERAVEEIKSVILAKRCCLDFRQESVDSIIRSFVKEE